MNWDPTQYNRFKDQRSQPFFDLLGLVQSREQESVIDLGCGTGELTRRLADSLGARAVLGIDSAPSMLAQASAFARPGLEFRCGAIEDFVPDRPPSLVFSNAALQWVNSHERLLPRILGWVAPGGEIAIQMPFNYDHPSHRLAQETAHALFPAKFSSHPDRPVLGLERYAELLFAAGFRQQQARIQVYGHSMNSGQDVVEWTKGTLLTAYQSQLSAEEFAQFLGEYRACLLAVIGEGPYFYAFKRMLLWGRRAEST